MTDRHDDVTLHETHDPTHTMLEELEAMIQASRDIIARSERMIAITLQALNRPILVEPPLVVHPEVEHRAGLGLEDDRVDD